jgi:hypothetical protein
VEDVNEKRTKTNKQEKIVTIKGVNQELYEQFTNLVKAKGKNIGSVFTIMIDHFRKRGTMTKFALPLLKHFTQEDELQIELIENLPELVVTKGDLERMNQVVKFHFRNIHQLSFAKNISVDLFMNKIFRITNCQIDYPSSIPKLIALSKYRAKLPLKHKSRELKDITIRNVEEQAYNEFVAYCQIQNKLIGEAVNELLLQIIPEMEINQIIIGELQLNPNDLLVISSNKELHITNRNLIEIDDKKVIFHRIQKLTFNNSITNEQFLSSIAGIYNCNQINLPNKITNLVAAARVREFPS